MTEKERKLALYCLKASSDYHSEICEECINYPNCDHTIQDDVTETIIKALEQEPILNKIRAEIEYIIDNTYDSTDYDKSLYNGAYKDGLYEALDIIDKYKTESEVNADADSD